MFHRSIPRPPKPVRHTHPAIGADRPAAAYAGSSVSLAGPVACADNTLVAAERRSLTGRKQRPVPYPAVAAHDLRCEHSRQRRDGGSGQQADPTAASRRDGPAQRRSCGRAECGYQPHGGEGLRQ